MERPTWFAILKCTGILPTANDKETLIQMTTGTRKDGMIDSGTKEVLKQLDDKPIDANVWMALDAHHERRRGSAAAGCLLWQCDNKKCVESQNKGGFLPFQITRALHFTRSGAGKNKPDHWTEITRPTRQRRISPSTSTNATATTRTPASPRQRNAAASIRQSKSWKKMCSGGPARDSALALLPPNAPMIVLEASTESSTSIPSPIVWQADMQADTPDRQFSGGTFRSTWMSSSR